MINEYEKGGLKVPNTRLFAKLLKLTWVKKYFDVDNKNPWKELLQKELKTVAGDNFWYFTKTVLQSKISANPFWQNVVNIWSSLQKHHATTPEEILTQPILHNDFIKIGNTTFCYKTWCENGIFFIKDIINNNGNFFSLEQLNA